MCHPHAFLDGCVFDFQGTVPPFDSDVNLKAGDSTNKVHPAPGIGFIVSESSIDSLLEDTAVLASGEKVTFGEYELAHLADGTIRAEGPDTLSKRDPQYADTCYWFELSPDGQYSSHRFDPANPPEPIADPASHFAAAIKPKMTYCNYFPAKGGTFVVSATNPADCLGGTSVVQRFVYEDNDDTATYPGNGVTWYCLNGDEGIVCNNGSRDHVTGQYIPDEQ